MKKVINPLTNGVIRHIMTTGGGAGVVAVENDVLQILYAVIALVGVIWSIVDKVRYRGSPVPPSPISPTDITLK